MKRTLMAACIALALVGCMRIEKHDDLGQACLGEVEAWDTGSVAIEAGEPTPVTVVFSECSSGSVDWSEQGCTVEVQDGDVLVTTFVRSATPRRAQTDSCNWVSWDCGTVELDEGEHTLTYGAGQTTLDVPYAGAAVCVENR
jgi:hypothetical protein